MGANDYNRTNGYDLAGNRTSVGTKNYAFDAANKITTSANANALYDNDGNLTQLTGTNLTERRPLWNHRGELTKFLNPNGTQASQQAYMTDGRRAWTQVTGGLSTHYVYDGDMIIGEVIKTGSTSYIGAVYTWGADGLVSSRLTPNGTPKSLWYHYGPQGETRQLTNSAAAIVDTYLYDAYGVPLATTGTDYNPFRYGGQFGYYTLPTLGVINCGARWYDPQMGRWFSRDPIEYNGGENLYSYVGSNPVIWCDPDGTDWKSIRDWVWGYSHRIYSGIVDASTFGLPARQVSKVPALATFAAKSLNTIRGSVPTSLAGRNGADAADISMVFLATVDPVLLAVPLSRLSFGRAGPPTFKTILTTQELKDFKRLSSQCPDYMPPLKAPVRVLTKQEVAQVRQEVKGAGHHRHPIAFGGRPNPPEGTVPTGDTRSYKNPKHVEVTNFWNRVLRRIRSR